MTNFCVDLESGRAFIYERTLETDYLQGRFGAVPNVDVVTQTQYIHHAQNIVEPSKLVNELRKLADKIEADCKC